MTWLDEFYSLLSIHTLRSSYIQMDDISHLQVNKVWSKHQEIYNDFPRFKLQKNYLIHVISTRVYIEADADLSRQEPIFWNRNLKCLNPFTGSKAIAIIRRYFTYVEITAGLDKLLANSGSSFLSSGKTESRNRTENHSVVKQRRRVKELARTSKDNLQR